MKIEIARPPNFEAIRAVFPNAVNKGVIFAYGDTIYNPFGVSIPRELVVHEATHGMRQKEKGIEAWWDQYLHDPRFMLDEELYAHHNEYKACVKRHGHRPRDLRRIAERMSGPLYGHALTFEQAKHAILTGEVK